MSFFPEYMGDDLQGLVMEIWKVADNVGCHLSVGSENFGQVQFEGKRDKSCLRVILAGDLFQYSLSIA